MALLQDPKTGEVFFEHEDGQLQYVEEPGLFIQAQRQMRDLGSGVQELYGELTDNQELIEQSRVDTAARNRTFAGADEMYPYQSMIGQSLPGMATAVVSGGSSLMGQIATSMAFGAAESALDTGEGGNMGDRAQAGAVGGLFGDIGGRMAGRVFNGLRGALQDAGYATGVLKRPPAANPNAAAAEAQGLETAAYQRMEQDTPAQLLASRTQRGADLGINPTGETARRELANKMVYKDRAIEAVGMDPAMYDDLGGEFIGDALDRFDDEFMRISEVAAESGPIEITEQLAKELKGARDINKLRGYGKFQGLDAETPYLAPGEYIQARRTLAEESASEWNNGSTEVGQVIDQMLDGLDKQVEKRLPKEFLPDYARLREQYRVFRILEAPNVINADGVVNPTTLKRRLEANNGFGRTARSASRTTNNPESQALIDVAQAGGTKDLAPWQTSGTPEGLALRDTANDIRGAATDLAAGNPIPALGVGGKLMSPAVIGAANAGEGKAFQGLYTPNALLQRGGSAGGRGLLDEMLYPFFGVEDERQRQ